MVTAGEVCKQVGIPRYVLYRLVDQGKVPAYPGERPPYDFSNRRYYRFKLSEVQAAWAALRALREIHQPDA